MKNANPMTRKTKPKASADQTGTNGQSTGKRVVRGRVYERPLWDKLESIGIKPLCDRLASGETQRDIAKSLGVSSAVLSAYLHAANHADAFACARRASGDAMADEATFVMRAARGKDNAWQNWARNYEAHLRWRAAVANPRYSERQAVELSGPNGGPIQSQVAIQVYVPANHREQVGQSEPLEGENSE